MRFKTPAAAFALLASWACQTSPEGPMHPAPIQASPSIGPAGNGVPSPSPTPVPSPSPAPSPVTQVPRPSPTPTAPSPSPVPSPVSTIPSPSPVPSNEPLAPNTIDSIRVGFFGINCGRGVPVPRNGERILPRGCRGYVTATPKQANGDDVPAAVHGPNIEWFVLTGDDVIEVEAPTFASDFNKDVVGVRPGAFGLCATVRGVTGCLMGTVVP